MNIEISLKDGLMSGLAMLALKDPSLLAFDRRRRKPENLRRVFGLEAIPSDTQMRTILDEVAPENLRPLFKPPPNLHRTFILGASFCVIIRIIRLTEWGREIRG